jgi:transcriptional regulator with XRE-family HTH domain
MAAGTGNPTARRRELGYRLRSMRAARGMTVEEVAGHLRISPSQISRFETGHRRPKERDIHDLAALYELSDDDRQQLLNLAAESRQEAWWQPFNLPHLTYVSLEAEAVEIRDFNLAIVPGLLQTKDYALAWMRVGYARRTPAVALETMVEVRMERRARVLGTARSAGTAERLTAIVDEAALRREVGGPKVMREQLRTLREAADLPNVTLQVLPFGAGALPVGTNKFIILSFGRPSMPDLVYLESLTGELIIENEPEVQLYHDAFTALSSIALSPEDSVARIASIERGFDC